MLFVRKLQKLKNLISKRRTLGDIAIRLCKIWKRDRSGSRQERRRRLWSMNTEEIEYILNRHLKHLMVYSARRLYPSPRLLVCNTDPAHKSGRHWVCVHVANGYGEYFDSFGCRPNVVFEHYLNRHCSSCKWYAFRIEFLSSQYTISMKNNYLQ